MRFIPFAAHSFEPAGHENPTSPAVLRKILVGKADLQPGRVQMINWAALAVGKQFARHYHEDMQEVFVLLSGEAEITVDADTVAMHCGDTIVIDPREVHQMRNLGPDDVEYLAIGITSEAGGRTVVVSEEE